MNRRYIKKKSIINGNRAKTLRILILIYSHSPYLLNGNMVKYYSNDSLMF